MSLPAIGGKRNACSSPSPHIDHAAWLALECPGSRKGLGLEGCGSQTRPFLCLRREFGDLTGATQPCSLFLPSGELGLLCVDPPPSPCLSGSGDRTAPSPHCGQTSNPRGSPKLHPRGWAVLDRPDRPGIRGTAHTQWAGHGWACPAVNYNLYPQQETQPKKRGESVPQAPRMSHTCWPQGHPWSFLRKAGDRLKWGRDPSLGPYAAARVAINGLKTLWSLAGRGVCQARRLLIKVESLDLV